MRESIVVCYYVEKALMLEYRKWDTFRQCKQCFFVFLYFSFFLTNSWLSVLARRPVFVIQVNFAGITRQILFEEAYEPYLQFDQDEEDIIRTTPPHRKNK